MKLKNTPWTDAEDALLAQAITDKISPARLSVRLNRSVNTIKRRMRTLGLSEKNHAHWKARSHIEEKAKRWIDTAAGRNLIGLMSLYSPDASLECACSGDAVYAGHEAILQYWVPKLRSALPKAFSLIKLQIQDGRAVVDISASKRNP